MKRMKKVILPFIMVTALFLTGCGKELDASGYVKALLDNTYKNDSTEFVAQGVGTKEEAAEIYEQGIQKEIDTVLAQAPISEELTEEFKTVMADIYKNVKYTVGESTKQDDGSYAVEVSYQKMKIFAPAMEQYNTNYNAYVEETSQKAQEGGEIPSDDEMNEELFTMLKDALKDSIANVTYEDEASMTVHVELQDNTYTINEDDVYNLELALFDSDAAGIAQ